MASASTEFEDKAQEKASGIVVMLEACASSPAESSQVVICDEDTIIPPVLFRDEERRLCRKIDWHIMPIVTIMFLCSYVDRSNIGNAKLLGLVAQLDLRGNQLGIALSMFYISSMAFAIPANLVLKKFRPSRWLPGIIIVSGIITCLTGLVKTYQQLVVVRVCLGIAEAGVTPGLVFYVSMLYPRDMLQTKFALLFGGASFGGAFSGLLAFAISFMSGTGGLLGWSWIFVIEGIFTVVIGVIACSVLVDFADTARFLTPEERAYVFYRKRFNDSTLGENEEFALRHVWEALTDWQVWLLGLLDFSVSVAASGISLFLPSIVHGLGFNPTISQLLTAPPFVVATPIVIIVAVWSDRVQLRSPFILGSQLLCISGLAISASNAGIGVKYLGTFLVVTGAGVALPASYTWLSNNVPGRCKRAVAIAVKSVLADMGGIVAGNVFRSQDAPRYIPGFVVEIAILGMGLVVTAVITYFYHRANRRQEIRIREMDVSGGKHAPEALTRMAGFRYML